MNIHVHVAREKQTADFDQMALQRGLGWQRVEFGPVMPLKIKLSYVSLTIEVKFFN